MDLREPKRKRVGSHIKPQQPFPISIESENNTPFGNDILPIFFGNFTGDSVVVCNPEEMVSLYTMGFFGKGSFSRGYPSFEISKKGIPPIIKERQWKRRKSWMDKMEKNLPCTIIQDKSSKSNHKIGQDKLDDDDQSEQNKDTETTTPMEVEETKTTSIEVQDNNPECPESLPTEEQKTKSSNETDVVEETKTTMEVQDNSSECPNSSLTEEQKTNSTNETNLIEESKTTLMEVQDNHQECSGSSPTEEQKTNSTKEAHFNQSDMIREIALHHLKYSLTNSEITETNSKVLVLADSDDEDIEKVIRNPHPHLEDERIRTVVETLILTLEEAFFLSYALGCLHVIDMSGNDMTLKQLWVTFCEVKSDFIELYVAYHHFRAKGWVVKTGHKFGGDFLLYKQGPAFYHASYIVLVEKVNSRLEKANTSLTWTKLHGLNRLAESSGKDIITCQVMFPDSLTTEDLMTPKMLPKFQVNELHTKRWISSLEREEKET